MKKIIFALLMICGFVSCNLDENPKSNVTKEPVFNSEDGLKLYTYSFYNILPSASAATQMDNMCDYSVRTQVPDFIREGAYSSQRSDIGWDWQDWQRLRNINYFIGNCNSPSLPEAVKQNYIGIARFFRAYYYFDKVKRYGDVPWINKAMETEDPDLYSGRDSRTLVMDSVLSDLDYASKHIIMDTDPTSSLITKAVVYAFKSRVCLFEGTFRKYHTEYNLSSTADEWLKESVDAANELMTNAKFKYTVYTASGISKAYRELFTSQKAIQSEVILASVCDKSQSVLNDANWWWTSSTYGSRISLSRVFVNTYLNLDGTAFTGNPGYKTMVFSDEVKNRDKRLEQTIRTPGYQRIDGGVAVAAPPIFSYTYTGYQPIKFCLDDVYYDSGSNNDNTIPLIRYAEVLLNYAEAKAELGTLTNSDWEKTVGALRARAGITGGLNAKPTTIDAYFQASYFPEISDPTLLEIRRERSIELVFEGLRFPDIIRWNKGKLIEMDWNGFYVPAIEVPMDLNNDGILDVCFTYQDPVKDPIKGVTYVNVDPNKGGKVNPQQLKNGTSGELTWLNNLPRKWNNKFYLYPVPESAILMNPNLKPQNTGW
ncbi:RagB/SusD family nutrient uptake outer membrane protein [Dysgonomonas sp. ZJ279]|uniref:RagB/SusD family nutrient uptake outer membrane protein n=1 Tax=Dysgonomonas sp. ZJ279 TaxID=2709796 RepID=UPI0013EB35D6|nr:RagB/SusD family nutrient uptake outer membrane protein [Dysgonomonas sp. ZJ279]